VQTLIHYPISVHHQRAYHNLCNLNLPISEEISENTLSLPISPILENKNAERVIRILNRYCTSPKNNTQQK